MAQQINFGQLADPEVEALERQREYAKALRTQGMTPPEQQVVSGRVVPFSVTQGLAQMLKAYTGRKLDEDVTAKQTELGERKRMQGAAELQGILEALRGKPAIPSFQTGANEMGDESVMQNPVAAQAPDTSKALAMALQSRNPVAQQIGGSLLTASLPKAAKMERVEIPDGKGGKRVGFVDMNSPNPFSTFQEGGTMPTKQEFVNGQAVNPYSTQPGTTIPKQLDPTDPRKDLLIPGADWRLVPNAPLVGVKRDLAVAGKPTSNTTVINAGPKAFETELGKLDAEQLGKWRSAAEAANNTLGVVQNLRSAEAQGAYSGAAADAKLAAARIVETFTGITPKGQVGSELYNAESKKLILEHIKTLGANPSNADREFIEKTVPQLATSAQARAAMANFMEKKAANQIDLYERADKYARENRGLGGFRAIPQVPTAPAAPTAPSGFKIIGVQ
jgi:hypothetical protein